MEHYKYNMAECCHAGLWQEDMFGRTCLDCGFNTLHNDFGMYNEREAKGIVTMINEEMDKAVENLTYQNEEFVKLIDNVFAQMPFHRHRNRERLDYLFTQLNPEE